MKFPNVLNNQLLYSNEFKTMFHNFQGGILPH